MHAFLLRLWFVGVWTLLSLTACTSDDSAEPEVQFLGGTSVVSFDTVTFSTSTAFLQGTPRTAARITGELSLPASNEEHLPAVILMHGASGVSDTDRLWAAALNSLGLATFLVDGLTGRDLAGVRIIRATLSLHPFSPVTLPLTVALATAMLLAVG